MTNGKEATGSKMSKGVKLFVTIILFLVGCFVFGLAKELAPPTSRPLVVFIVGFCVIYFLFWFWRKH